MDDEPIAPEILTLPTLQPDLKALIDWVKTEAFPENNIVAGCPDVPELGHTHKEDGWTLAECEACGRAVWLGPETERLLLVNAKLSLLCIPDAAALSNAFKNVTGAGYQAYDLEKGEFFDTRGL